MKIQAFTESFLPQLLLRYVRRELPLHALVDFEVWHQVFPDSDEGTATEGSLLWYQVQFTCNPLQDGSLLFTFLLPSPSVEGQAKYAAIRFSLKESPAQRHIAFYTLLKPHSYYDIWDIYELPITAATTALTPVFRCKISGTDSLRNFIYTVQQLPF